MADVYKRQLCLCAAHCSRKLSSYNIKSLVVFFSRIGMIDTSEEIFMFNVEEELKKLPRKPGVYIMRDDKDVILYVGKAINLHNRVRSYFRENIGRGPAIDQMVSLIARFEYIVTDSEPVSYTHLAGSCHAGSVLPVL